MKAIRNFQPDQNEQILPVLLEMDSEERKGRCYYETIFSEASISKENCFQSNSGDKT